jgi:hypothetical protein
MTTDLGIGFPNPLSVHKMIFVGDCDIAHYLISASLPYFLQYQVLYVFHTNYEKESFYRDLIYVVYVYARVG